MKPNAFLLTALFLLAGFLFVSLPEQAPALSSSTDGRQETAARAEANVSAEIARIRRDYAALAEETARLRTRLAHVQAANEQGRHVRLPAASAESGETSPGMTIYLDTSKLRQLGDQRVSSREWTAVSVRDAGQAPDGSKQAVIALSTVTRKAAEPSVQTLPVSHWH